MSHDLCLLMPCTLCTLPSLQAAVAHLEAAAEAQAAAGHSAATQAPAMGQAVLGGSADPLGDWALFLGGRGGRVPAPRPPRRAALEGGQSDGEAVAAEEGDGGERLWLLPPTPLHPSLQLYTAGQSLTSSPSGGAMRCCCLFRGRGSSH